MENSIFKKKHIRKILCISFFIFFLIIFIPFLYIFTYWYADNYQTYFYTDLTLDGLLALHAGILTFIGTVSLGAVTVWQNKKSSTAQIDMAKRQLKMVSYQAQEIKLKQLKDAIIQTIKSIDSNIFSKIANVRNTENRKELLEYIHLTRKTILDAHTNLNFFTEFCVSECPDCTFCQTPCAVQNFDKTYKENINKLRKNLYAYIVEYIDEIDTLAQKISLLTLCETIKEEQFTRLTNNQKEMDMLFKDNIIYGLAYKYTNDPQIGDAIKYINDTVKKIINEQKLIREELTDVESDINKNNRNYYIEYINSKKETYQKLTHEKMTNLIDNARKCQFEIDSELIRIKNDIINYKTI